MSDEATLHLIHLNSLPDECIHHIHLLNQLQAPVVASIQSIPFALVQKSGLIEAVKQGSSNEYQQLRFLCISDIKDPLIII